MSIQSSDISRIAKLSRLDLTPEAQEKAITELENILSIIQTLQSVDTSGVKPLSHPLSLHHDITLRLREDVAAPTQSVEERDELMSNAPAKTDGLFLVPKVID